MEHEPIATAIVQYDCYIRWKEWRLLNKIERSQTEYLMFWLDMGRSDYHQHTVGQVSKGTSLK